MALTLDKIAEVLGLELSLLAGNDIDSSTLISSIAPLDTAKAGQISFLSDKKHLNQLQKTQATAVIIKAEQREDCNVAALLSDNPYLSYAKLSEYFLPTAAQVSGIHPSATVHETAMVADSASIAANVVIEAGACIAENCVVGANSVIGANSALGAGTKLDANVTLYRDVILGQEVTISSGSVIGSQGFGFAPTGDFSAEGKAWQKIHQLGGVRIGNHVDIGANTCIDCGTLTPTIIEDGVIIDNQVHIAHNCEIGRNTAIAGATAFAGSTKVGENCVIAGACAIAGHISIAAGTQIMGMSKVTGSIKEAGVYSSGTGLMPVKDWRKSAVRFGQLEQMQKRIKELEKQLSQID